MRSTIFMPIAAVLFLAGCSSSYLVDEPLVFGRHAPSPTAQKESLAAMIMALESSRWYILGANTEQGLLRAKACRGAYCISIDVQVAKDGGVRVTRTPEQYISRKGGRILQQWARKVEKNYYKFRSSTSEILLGGLSKRAFPPLTKEEMQAKKEPEKKDL